jgi:hypothetical protein
MIGVSFAATGAAAGGLPRRRRSKGRAARASVAARRRAHGARESRAGADASLGAFGAATTAAAGTVVRTVGRDAVPVAADTVTGRAGVARSPTCLPEREALACCSCGFEGKRVSVERVTGVLARCDRRLADAGRPTTAGAAPAGAVPRKVSFAGDDSAGAGSTAPGADRRAGVEGVGAAAGDGAGGRGGSSVNGST